MKKILFVLTASLLSPASSAHCDIYPELSVEHEFLESKYVVVAKVSSRKIVVDPIEDPEGYEAELFLIELVEALKGQPNRQISIYNENNSGRFLLDVGKTYLLFVNSDENFNWISSCGNSGLLDEKLDILGFVRQMRY